MVLPACIITIALASANAAPAAPSFFPVPTSVAFDSSSPTLTLAPDFKVIVAKGSECDVLTDVAARYTAILKVGKESSSAVGDTLLHTLVLSTSSLNVTLAPDTSSAYTLTVTASSATVSGESPFGAMYGAETFAQLAEGVAFQAVVVKDAPEFKHRGLTVDVGRRIAPIPLLHSIIDGLSFTKMNVLHLGITGPAVRVVVPALPELTSHLEVGQFYTAHDISGIVEYARMRGVRIIPEFDVPAHAAGLWPLAGTRGLQFCDDERTTLRDDAVTIGLVQQVFDAVVALFPDAVVHVGGDETCPHGVCPDACDYSAVNNVERAVQTHLVDTHGRTPMGWNEVWSEPEGGEPNGALPGRTILQNWKGAGNGDTVDAGFKTVDSQYKLLYLNLQCCRVVPPSTGKFTPCYWIDAAATLHDPTNATARALLLGAEAAMWSDEYCPVPLCNRNGTFGWMQPPSMDAVYTQSFGNQVFPNTAATGASLWHYTERHDATLDLPGRFNTHNDRLIARGVVACPTGKYCDWGTKDGVPYDNHPTKPNARITLINKTPFHIQVKARTPCASGTGASLVSLEPGENFTAVDDFIVTSSKGIGDPFALWIGDGTWQDLTMTLDVTYDAVAAPGYLAYTTVLPYPVPLPGIRVVAKSRLSSDVIYLKSWDRATKTAGDLLCALLVPNASCVVDADFIALRIVDGKVTASGDPFSSWVGDESFLQAKLWLDIAETSAADGGAGYLAYTHIAPGAL